MNNLFDKFLPALAFIPSRDTLHVDFISFFFFFGWEIYIRNGNWKSIYDGRHDMLHELMKRKITANWLQPKTKQQTTDRTAAAAAAAWHRFQLLTRAADYMRV